MDARKLQCERLGCGAMFAEDKNQEGSCQFHVYPVSDDIPKEWTCCKQTFTPGCKTGKHTSEKLALAKPRTAEKLASAKPVPRHVLQFLGGFGSTPFQQISHLVWTWCLQPLVEVTRPYAATRWVLPPVLAYIFASRLYRLPEFLTIGYGLSVYFLNLLIGFITPRIDFDNLIQGPDAFKPIIRRLPEFDLWYTVTLAFITAILMTCFEAFKIPYDSFVTAAYWGCLLCLFVFNMAQNIYHNWLRSTPPKSD